MLGVNIMGLLRLALKQLVLVTEWHVKPSLFDELYKRILGSKTSEIQSINSAIKRSKVSVGYVGKHQ